uniref:Probable aspartyl protease At4g16563 n=1 Tax=Tanacetum cinerariifolium TaxID=118510 RepID=A0A699T5X2_TANCI|nr:probable aspartyl protease At4g16563 [Tanacetum cinerariifolium]
MYLLLISARCLDALWTPLRCPSVKTTHLYEDVLELPMSAPPSLTVEIITFGCAHEALAEPVGVAGFGGRALSLP